MSILEMFESLFTLNGIWKFNHCPMLFLTLRNPYTNWCCFFGLNIFSLAGWARMQLPAALSRPIHSRWYWDMKVSQYLTPCLDHVKFTYPSRFTVSPLALDNIYFPFNVCLCDWAPIFANEQVLKIMSMTWSPHSGLRCLNRKEALVILIIPSGSYHWVCGGWWVFFGRT